MWLCAHVWALMRLTRHASSTAQVRATALITGKMPEGCPTIQLSQLQVSFLILVGLPPIVSLDGSFGFQLRFSQLLKFDLLGKIYQSIARIHLLDYINQVTVSPLVRRRVAGLKNSIIIGQPICF